MIHRRLLFGPFILVALTVACGGRTASNMGNGTGSGSGTGSGTGTGGGSGSGTGSGDAGSCVNIVLGPSDQQCGASQDCDVTSTGQVCSGDCACGNTPVNNTAALRIDLETKSVQLDDCPCEAIGVPTCVQGQCTICPIGGDGMGHCADGGNEPEAGPGDSGSDAPNDASFIDGAQCVNIDLSTYSQTCSVAGDCILIFTGEICVPSDCSCNYGFVNITGQARYDQAINSLPSTDCSCATPGALQCIAGKCAAGGAG